MTGNKDMERQRDKEHSTTTMMAGEKATSHYKNPEEIHKTTIDQSLKIHGHNHNK